MSTSLNRRALVTGATALPALAIPAVAKSTLEPTHGAIEELWNRRLEGVARWKAHRAFVKQQEAKLPSWSNEWTGMGPNNPFNWVGEQMKPFYARLGLPEDVTVSGAGQHITEIDAELDRLKQTDDYRRRAAEWDDRREQLAVLRSELGIGDAEEIGNAVLDDLNDIEDEMAEAAEGGEINALAGWCLSRLALGDGDSEDDACLLTLKAITPSVTFPPVVRAIRQFLGALAASDDNDGQWGRGTNFDWCYS
jgi:hypothetical protein